MYTGGYAELWYYVLLSAVVECTYAHRRDQLPHVKPFASLQRKVCIRCTAEAWIRGADSGVLNFFDLCDVFNLDPAAIQAVVVKEQEKIDGFNDSAHKSGQLDAERRRSMYHGRGHTVLARVYRSGGERAVTRGPCGA